MLDTLRNSLKQITAAHEALLLLPNDASREHVCQCLRTVENYILVHIYLEQQKLLDEIEQEDTATQ